MSAVLMSRLTLPTTHSFASRKSDSSSITELRRGLVLRQRMAPGFGEEEQRHEPQQEDGTHIGRRAAERFDLGFGRERASFEMSLEFAQSEWSAGRKKAPHVVTETRARAAQPRREELGQVNGETGEQGELAGAHDSAHPDVGLAIEELVVAYRGAHGQKRSDGES